MEGNENELDIINFNSFDKKKKYVLFIRHGYSLANMYEGVFLHQIFRNKYEPDPNLTDLGYQDATTIGKKLFNELQNKSIKFYDTIYTSKLSRTVETAYGIATGFNDEIKKIVTIPYINETPLKSHGMDIKDNIPQNHNEMKKQVLGFIKKVESKKIDSENETNIEIEPYDCYNNIITEPNKIEFLKILKENIINKEKDSNLFIFISHNGTMKKFFNEETNEENNEETNEENNEETNEENKKLNFNNLGMVLASIEDCNNNSIKLNFIKYLKQNKDKNNNKLNVENSNQNRDTIKKSKILKKTELSILFGLLSGFLSLFIFTIFAIIEDKDVLNKKKEYLENKKLYDDIYNFKTKIEPDNTLPYIILSISLIFIFLLIFLIIKNKNKLF